MSGARVEVIRGERVESVHEVDVAVAGATGAIVAFAGDPDVVVFARSALKPFQALPLVQDGVADRYGLTAEELAICCGSHSGEPHHVEVARSILARIDVGEDALACGPHRPFNREAAGALSREGREPGRLHNNCSGKHAGMLALARAHDWPLEGYQEKGHPVQQRMLEEVSGWTGVAAEEVETAVDGCGVVTFALPLRATARAFAGLAAEPSGSPADRVLEAMTAHPFLVGGTERLCTRLMEVTHGRIVAKLGAEGVYGALDVETGQGIALKARDGARRAAEVALLAVLDALDLLEPDELDALGQWARPAVENTRGERVGGLRAVVELGGRHG